LPVVFFKSVTVSKEYCVKNISKLVALAIVIAFSAAACGGDDPDNTDKPDKPVDPVDGVNWTAVSDSTFGSNTINSVSWGNGVFVAAGVGGKIAYSADGISWTAVSDSTFGASAVKCVAWGDGKFMAGGEGGKMAYSADGISWTAVSTSTFGSNEINGLTWGDKWVAVGRSRMAYSSDGTSWTGSDSNAPFGFGQGSPNLYDVSFGNSTFVLVGAAGGQGHGASLAYSNNGTNWTKRDMEDLVATALVSVAYGNGKFVAISQDTVLYSTLGTTTWNYVEDFATMGKRLSGIAAGNGKFVAVGPNDTIMYSADGISWTVFDDIALNSHFNKIAYGGGTWVAVGLNGKMAYSVEE
jgi:hypothetical protein